MDTSEIIVTALATLNKLVVEYNRTFEVLETALIKKQFTYQVEPHSAAKVLVTLKSQGGATGKIICNKPQLIISSEDAEIINCGDFHEYYTSSPALAIKIAFQIPDWSDDFVIFEGTIETLRDYLKSKNIQYDSTGGTYQGEKQYKYSQPPYQYGKVYRTLLIEDADHSGVINYQI